MYKRPVGKTTKNPCCLHFSWIGHLGLQSCHTMWPSNWEHGYHLGACQGCRVSGPPPDLLNHHLCVGKTPPQRINMHAKALAWNIFQEGKSLTPVRRSVIKKARNQCWQGCGKKGSATRCYWVLCPCPSAPAFLPSRLPVVGSLLFCSSSLSLSRESPGAACLFQFYPYFLAEYFITPLFFLTEPSVKCQFAFPSGM